jgi:hypothetical protein
MESTSDLRPVNDEHGPIKSHRGLTKLFPLEKPLTTVGGFTLSNFDVVAIVAAVLMVCGPLLGAVIRVG